jgi:hypothetical protein
MVFPGFGGGLRRVVVSFLTCCRSLKPVFAGFLQVSRFFHNTGKVFAGDSVNVILKREKRVGGGGLDEVRMTLGTRVWYAGLVRGFFRYDEVLVCSMVLIYELIK